MIQPKYPGIYPEIDDPKAGGLWEGVGTGRERSIQCMERFSEAMGDRFCDGVNLLDYGCGSGRFANFLSTQLASFHYLGVEPPEYAEHHRETWQHLDGSPHVDFDKIGSHKEALWLSAGFGCDVVLLISVLTHLPLTMAGYVLARFRQVVEDDGIVVFSAFVGKRAIEGPHKATAKKGERMRGYHKWVRHTVAGIESVAEALGWSLAVAGKWDDDGKKHTIFVARRRA